MKKALMRVFAFICVIVISISFATPIYAVGTPWAHEYAYALNEVLYREGTLSTTSTGDFITFDATVGEYPQGVIYADLIHFEDNSEPALAILRSSRVRGAISVDIYSYNPETGDADHITTLSKGYRLDNGVIREVALGSGDDLRYVVFTDYRDGQMVNCEYYTLLDGAMYKAVDAPQNITLYGMATYSNSYLHPEIDVSQYNEYISRFFSDLKADAADCIEYENIEAQLDAEDADGLKAVLNKTAGFDVTFDIGDYPTMSEYALAVKSHDGEAKLNAITHVYNLGEELYYVRYSTDRAYYNGAILRRTDAVKDGYQILLVRNDFIPLTESECENAKNTYLKNRLLLEKPRGRGEHKPLIEINNEEGDKPLKVPKVVSQDLRVPIALIGGGVLLALFVVLFVVVTRNKDDE